jgi:hypothetical protein
MKTYLQTDFKFSDEAFNWIVKSYSFINDKRIGHNLYRSFELSKHFNESVIWKNTLAFNEVMSYLTQYGIDPTLYGDTVNGPDVFISNRSASSGHYPHIDQTRNFNTNTPGYVFPVKTRFNIPIYHNPDEDMYWWDEVTPGHKLVGPVKVNENFTQLLGIRGLDCEEKLKNLGPPTSINRGIFKNHTSAFVRTDCAHSISAKQSGVRLIVTLALDYSINELLSHLDNAYSSIVSCDSSV